MFINCSLGRQLSKETWHLLPLANSICSLLSQMDGKDSEYLNQLRSSLSSDYNELKALQKSLGKDGIYLKEIVRESSRRYKSACLLLGQIAPDLSGDSKFVPMKQWNQELWNDIYSVACSVVFR